MGDFKLYEERDAMALGEHYVRHVEAMTREQLHFKSDIAAELAYRDQENAKLRDALKAAEEALEKIAKRPNLPNPDRDADWKNCQKESSHEAKEALEKIRIVMK